MSAKRIAKSKPTPQQDVEAVLQCYKYPMADFRQYGDRFVVTFVAFGKVSVINGTLDEAGNYVQHVLDDMHKDRNK